MVDPLDPNTPRRLTTDASPCRQIRTPTGATHRAHAASEELLREDVEELLRSVTSAPGPALPDADGVVADQGIL